MTNALKTEWVVCSDNTDIDTQVAALERYCVGKVRVSQCNFDPDSPMKVTAKLEFEVLADTDMDKFWDLVDDVIDDESED
jgi:hypothetical protein